jgi:hypothetical protein
MFDQKAKLLSQMLLNSDRDKDMAKHFEGAVTNLWGLLGFSVSNYGRFPKLQDGPDIIAVAPDGNVAVIECTTGLLDLNDKIAKLVQRTHALSNTLSASGHGHKAIQPVSITQLSRSEVAANLEDAEKHHIAVMCNEDLSQLLTQIPLFPNPDSFFRALKKYIPQSKSKFPWVV